MKKVIYISFTRLTDRIVRDYCIDYLIQKGMVVEYWDIVALVRSEYDEPGMESPPYLHVLRSFRALEAMLMLPENRGAFYVMIISCEGRFMKIFQLLSRFNCCMSFVAQGARPVIVKPRLSKVLNHACHPVRLSKIILNMAIVYAYRKFKLVKPFDIVFAAGEMIAGSEQYALKVVPINLCDYEQYVKVKSAGGRIVKGRYAVHLDINLPYHDDLSIKGLPTINPEGYYRSLNRFFELLEAEYGIKVVIAAHPTADYRAETFNGREIYRLKTAEVVKDADFVIAMHSTTVSHAILNSKPVIFIYTDEMLSLYKETFICEIQALADYLRAPIYNVDAITHGKQVLVQAVNSECYDRYKYNFLTTHESEHTTTPEIFWREINACI